ncbi:hypothetical protein NSS79_04610 [Paenibacillus sp. FSL L8-0436]|uniref:hypothetical protein n=1 Tax=Paenibacillus sp. FSL L8-0436 TaxID=2954686 RepID=UPI003159275C
MANTITRSDAETDQEIRCSNGLFSVVISVLTLSGSRIARTSDEKDFIIWLAEHDQSVLGSGTCGFTISEMPWSRDRMQLEKSFLDTTIEGAIRCLGWGMLDYTPNVTMLEPALNQFRTLVNELQETEIDFAVGQLWREEQEAERTLPGEYPVCGQHHVLLCWHGCVVCHENAGILPADSDSNGR